MASGVGLMLPSCAQPSLTAPGPPQIQHSVPSRSKQSATSSGSMGVKLVYHVPGVITSIAIDIGAALASSKGGFLELSFRDAVAEVVPIAKGSGKDSVLLSPQRAAHSSSVSGTASVEDGGAGRTVSVPSISDRFAPPRRNPRYANIIEQLEKKYGGRTSMRSEEEEEEAGVAGDDASSTGGGDEDGEDDEEVGGGDYDEDHGAATATAADGAESGGPDRGASAGPDGAPGGGLSKKKRKRRSENADYYDSEDSFIDDEEIIEKIEVNYKMKAVKTKHSGFFVSSGALETLNPLGGFALESSQDDGKGSGARKRPRVEGEPRKRSAAPTAKPPSAASKAALAALQSYTDAKGLKFTSRLYKELRVVDDITSKNGDSDWLISSLVKLFAPEGMSRKAVEHKLEKLRTKGSSEAESRTSSRMQAINEASSNLLSALRPKLTNRVACLSLINSSNSSGGTNGSPTRSDLLELWTELWRDEEVLLLFDSMRSRCEDNARVETLRRDAAKSAKLEREKQQQQQASDKEAVGSADNPDTGSAAGIVNDPDAALSPSQGALLSGSVRGGSGAMLGGKAEEGDGGLPLEERMRHMMLCEISRQLRRICEEAAEVLWAVLPPALSETAAPETKPGEGKLVQNDKATFSNELLKIAKKARQAPSAVIKIDMPVASPPPATFSPKRPLRPSLSGSSTDHLVIPVPISADAAIASALLQVGQKKKPKKSLEGGSLKPAPTPGSSAPAARSDAAMTPQSPSTPADASLLVPSAVVAVAVEEGGSPVMGTAFDHPPEFDPRDFMIFNSN